MKILAAILILAIPILIWVLICRGMWKTAQKMRKEAEERLELIQTAESYTAKVASSEILKGWTVLMIIPDTGETGFYIRTTQRNIKNGTVIPMVKLPEYLVPEELLRHYQITPDESGNHITAADYARLCAGLHSEMMESDRVQMMSLRMLIGGLAAIIPACGIISLIVLLK